MTEKKFASHGDLEQKKVSFEQLSENAWAYTAEGDPNTGVIVGDDAVMIIDAAATPVMAQDVVRHVMVQRIIKAYADYEAARNEKRKK